MSDTWERRHPACLSFRRRRAGRDACAPRGPLDCNIDYDRIVVRKRRFVVFEVQERLSIDASHAGLFVDDFACLQGSDPTRRQPVQSEFEQQTFEADAPVDPPLHWTGKPGWIVKIGDYRAARCASIVEGFRLVPESGELAHSGLSCLGVNQPLIQSVAVACENSYGILYRSKSGSARECMRIQIAADDDSAISKAFLFEPRVYRFKHRAHLVCAAARRVDYVKMGIANNELLTVDLQVDCYGYSPAYSLF